MTTTTFAPGPLVRIYVDRKESAKRQEPVWIVERGGVHHRCRRVTIHGDLLSRDDWGAQPSLWLETCGMVEIEQDPFWGD